MLGFAFAICVPPGLGFNFSGPFCFGAIGIAGSLLANFFFRFTGDDFGGAQGFAVLGWQMFGGGFVDVLGLQMLGGGFCFPGRPCGTGIATGIGIGRLAIGAPPGRGL